MQDAPGSGCQKSLAEFRRRSGEKEELLRLKQRKAELTAIQSSAKADDKKTYEDWVAFLSRFCDIKALPDEDKKAIINTYVDRIILYRRPNPDGGKEAYYEIELELNPNNVEKREGNSLPLPSHPQISVFKNGFVVIKSGG